MQRSFFLPRRRAVARAALAMGLALQVGAAAAQAHRFDIPAQPLAPALAALARQAGLQVVFAPELAEGRQAPAVQGTREVADALRTLLAGSGLQGRVQGRTLVVERAPAPAPALSGQEGTLPEVKVMAQADRSGTTEGTGSFTTRTMSSATHLPLTLRETPQSVTVLTSARIEADNLVDLVDIAAAVPGLSLQSSEVRPVLESRGYIIESVTQDGIATPYDWYFGDSLGNLAMQDRVEVVRGATGLMQGAGNPSGAINMVRKRPTHTWQFKASTSV
ncbi:TonB-dependent receptor plug domain-containing protein, partial [Ottowia sp.]|uniref:TonB-dependent receptor n=1 Tax=Ottowia sp. TaxID=1898956 RepID=UPI0039E524CC